MQVAVLESRRIFLLVRMRPRLWFRRMNHLQGTSETLIKSESTHLQKPPLPTDTPATSPISLTPQSTDLLSQGQISEVQIESIDEIVELTVVSTFNLLNSIQIGKKQVGTLLSGTDKKDKIIGSSANEIIIGGAGQDVLKGGDGGDGFLFRDPNEFGKKEADKITDFDADEGDSNWSTKRS